MRHGGSWPVPTKAGRPSRLPALGLRTQGPAVLPATAGLQWAVWFRPWAKSNVCWWVGNRALKRAKGFESSH